VEPGTLRLFAAWLAAAAFTPLACALDTGPVDEAEAGGAAGTAPSAGMAGKSGAGGANPSGGSAGKAPAAGGAASGRGGGAGAGTGQAGSGGTANGGAGTQAGAGQGGTGGTSSAGRGGADNASGADGAGEGGAPDTGEAGAGGEPSVGSGGGSTSEEIPPGYVKAIIGVGYGGIRIVSRDGGLSWGSRASEAPSGGDDHDLLRAVAYGKGRWIASGWRLFSSDDGIEWTDHGYFQEDGIIPDKVIIEGLAYKDGYFYAAGDGNPSRIYRSEDGLEWSRHGSIGDTVKHTGLTYRGGVFVSYGDSETSYRSADGLSWEEMGIANATYCENAWKSLEDCHDAAWFDDGFYLIPEWGGDIRRSTTGSNFQRVYADDQENTLYRARAVAEGYVAPE
jgi:hypothetical protein